MKNQIQAGVFKARCLKILDEVRTKSKKYVITKRGEPYAMLVPMEKTERHLFGKMKGTIQFLGDIRDTTGEAWDADS